jgi:DNA-binding CsgD family transcriptional regulator
VLRVIAGDLKVVGRYSEARRHAEVVLEIARLAGSRKQEAAARKIIGYALVATGEDIDLGIHELRQALAIGREIGDEQEVIRATIDLSDSLIRLGRYDEATTIALEGAEAGRRRGVAWAEVGFVSLNAVEAMVPAGRWDDAERIIQQVLTLRAGVQIERMAHDWDALISAKRGQLDSASAALACAQHLGPDTVQPQLTMIVETARAYLSLATADLQEARQAVARMLDVGMSDDLRYVAPAAALGLRIEADRTSLARAWRDGRQLDAAVAAAHALADRVRGAARSAPSPPETANIALCEAELGRADGRSDPDQWREAVGAFVAVRQPFDAAYARFHEGEMALAVGGDRARAVAALSAAHAGAAELEAGPLATEIEALARRARITLTEPVPAESRMVAVASKSSAGAQPPLGLTAREIDVLRLMADGRTNPQIAESLYISRKTASHHVSNILRKLGVTSRVEAAGVAHRLGLDRDVPGAK